MNYELGIDLLSMKKTIDDIANCELRTANCELRTDNYYFSSVSHT